MTKFLEMFTPIEKGNLGLTDEAIYKAIQQGGDFVPVYGGTQDHDSTTRFVSEHGQTKYDEPITIFNGNGIIVSLDGSAGCMTHVATKRFALNHHAGFFRLKDNAQQFVVPEFFSVFLERQLQEVSISEGSKTLTLGTIESMDFELPSYDVQKNVMSEIKPLLEAKKRINGILQMVNAIKERTLVVDYHSYQTKEVPISEILDYHGGNSGLTEREIYQRILTAGQRYEVLSASTSEATQLGSIPIGYLNGKRLKVLEDKECIIVIRKGKAGTIYYRAKGKYALTDDAYLLTVKELCKYEVSLRWIIAQYRQLFWDYSSSSDNGTWNMTGFFEDVVVDIPSYEEQLEIVIKYDSLDLLENSIHGTLAKIDQLLSRQVVAIKD